MPADFSDALARSCHAARVNAELRAAGVTDLRMLHTTATPALASPAAPAAPPAPAVDPVAETERRTDALWRAAIDAVNATNAGGAHGQA